MSELPIADAFREWLAERVDNQTRQRMALVRAMRDKAVQRRDASLLDYTTQLDHWLARPSDKMPEYDAQAHYVRSTRPRPRVEVWIDHLLK